MLISELRARQKSVDIDGEITEIGETREFQKFGGSGRVANAKIKDSSGQITLTLWNEQIEKFKVGDKIRIRNGYVSEWRGELQLSGGKYGTVELDQSLEGGKTKIISQTVKEEICDGKEDEETPDLEEEAVDEE